MSVRVVCKKLTNDPNDQSLKRERRKGSPSLTLQALTKMTLTKIRGIALDRKTSCEYRIFFACSRRA
jgi:hypothetical protein